MQFLHDAFAWFFTNLFWSLGVVLKPAAYVSGQFLGTLMDGCLTVVVGILSVFDVGTLATQWAANWGTLDSSFAWILNASGISQGFTMLGTAYTIRFLLNLIPAEFTRV